MAEIKFSHRYEKMPTFYTDTRLIGVSVCDISKLPKNFIEWDTRYYESVYGRYVNYALPETGQFIVLTLFSDRPSLLMSIKASAAWTTIRRWTPEKEAYYRNLIGQKMYINIIDGD
jgi:hypothetical protein